MLTFARPKTIDEIRESCREAGFLFDTTQYDQGSDFVRIAFSHDGTAMDVLYSPFNGRFLGRLEGSGLISSSDDSILDAEPWFQALLDFVYVPKEGCPVDRTEICDRISALLAEHFGVIPDTLTDDSHFAGHLDMDWTERVELVLMVEDDFGVEITDADMVGLDTVGSLVDLVAQRLAEAAEG